MKKNQYGYSLIEIMVVLTLFALLILVASQTLILSLRSATKSESLGRVRENVEYAINVMERQLRSAKSIPTCPNLSPFSLNYLDKLGFPTSFACQNVGVDGYIASGSARLTNQNVSITDCSITCVPTQGLPPTIVISISAEDKSALPGAEKGKASSTTTVLLRQY